MIRDRYKLVTGAVISALHMLGAASCLVLMLFFPEVVRQIRIPLTIAGLVLMAGAPAWAFSVILKRRDRKRDPIAYHRILERINQVVWIEQLEPRKVFYVNPAFERVFGLPVSRIYANPEVWMHIVHPDDTEKMMAVSSSEVTGELSNEYRIRRPDGEERWIRSKVFPLRNEPGNFTLVAGIAEDITDLKSAVNEVRENRAQLIQAEKLASLGILVAGIAHEINNPNHTVMATSAILEEAWKDLGPLLDEYVTEEGDFTIAGTSFDDFRESMPLYLEGLSKASERIRDIVAHLRDFARQDVYDIGEVTDINEIVRSAVALMQSYIRKHTTKFVVEYAEDLPHVKGNRSRLQQVMVNLIQNACQSLRSDSDGVGVTTTVSSDGRYVRIRVRDQGVGIAAQDLDHILDPFYTTRRTSGSMGLGLSVSRSIIDDHSGQLRIESQPGSGTTAIVILPVAG